MGKCFEDGGVRELTKLEVGNPVTKKKKKAKGPRNENVTMDVWSYKEKLG